LIISIKPHSSIQKFFRGTDLRVDIASYSDLLYYLHSMHPDFITYIKVQTQNGLQEVFSFLDKNLREITKDDMYMRRPKDGDVIYIVPSIVGGGGKRGALALIAAAAFIFFLPAILASAGVMGVAGASGATLGTAAAVANIGILGSTLGAVTSSVGLSLAMMGITMLFMPKQQQAETSRDNDMFGSLVNTTNSGTPIPLNYGLVRVSGQLISGYIKTIESDPSNDKPVSAVGL
jgi:predicted phage tail protein